jgi:hypothetical protein
MKQALQVGHIYLATPVFLSESSPSRKSLTREVKLLEDFDDPMQGKFLNWMEITDGPELTPEEFAVVGSKSRTRVWHKGERRCNEHDNWRLDYVRGPDEKL